MKNRIKKFKEDIAIIKDVVCKLVGEIKKDWLPKISNFIKMHERCLQKESFIIN
jgi:hypothetical protein